MREAEQNYCMGRGFWGLPRRGIGCGRCRGVPCPPCVNGQPRPAGGVPLPPKMRKVKMSLLRDLRYTMTRRMPSRGRPRPTARPCTTSWPAAGGPAACCRRFRGAGRAAGSHDPGGGTADAADAGGNAGARPGPAAGLLRLDWARAADCVGMDMDEPVSLTNTDTAQGTVERHGAGNRGATRRRRACDLGLGWSEQATHAPGPHGPRHRRCTRGVQCSVQEITMWPYGTAGSKDQRTLSLLDFDKKRKAFLGCSQRKTELQRLLPDC